MRAPSFRCTDAEKGNNLILHYYSEREGLQDIVIGIIKTVAQQIHGTEIEMKVCFALFLFFLHAFFFFLSAVSCVLSTEEGDVMI